MATYAEAFKKSLEYFKGDDLAATVFVDKYALTDPQGDIKELTPDDTHWRLANEFARIEQKYPNPMSAQEIFDLLQGFKKVVPQGSPMAGIGNPYQIVSLSNCFVIDGAEDSFGGIFRADEEQGQIMKRRGGVGHDVSAIRPKGLHTSNAAKTTDGIGVFLERFSRTCREIAQGGRRGALMLTISVHHPEIRTFIHIKEDLKKVTGANISIRLSDEFMRAVKNGTYVQLRWPVADPNPAIQEWVDAKELWDEIVTAAWASAEPGLLFWDTITKNCPADAYASLGFRTIAVNPCAELTISAYDSCRLLLTNLFGFVRDPFTSHAKFDFDDFAKVTVKAQRLMDDLVDLELECIDKILAKIKSDKESADVKRREKLLWEKIRKSCAEGRRTGLGVTAVGDVVAALSMRYGSKESIEFVEKIYKTQAISSYKSSCIMAGERGTFPIFSHELEKDHQFIQKVVHADSELLALYEQFGRRNIANTTTAPAGSMSVETQTTSGIEGAYLIEYGRRKKITENDKKARIDFVDASGDKWQEFKIYHHHFKTWMEVTGKSKVEESPYWKATSADVDWSASIDLQAAAQRWTCHAISKTCNLPNDATKETVGDVYMRGWEQGCKGVTVYRDGCRDGVLISKDPKKEKTEVFADRNAPKRQMELPCDIHHVSVKGEPFTILVGLMDGRPYEVFGGHPLKDLSKSFETGKIVKVSHGKTKPATYNLHVQNGSEEVIEDINSAFENPTQGSFTRVISTALRHSTPVQFLAEQLAKGEKDSDMRVFSRVMARVLKKYVRDGTKPTGDKICGSCGQESLVYQEGCLSCKACGYSRCS